MATLPELAEGATKIDATGAAKHGAVVALLGGLNPLNFAAVTALDGYRQSLAQRAADEAAATLAAQEDDHV